ncbi:MAG: prepilin peptidase [Dinoroseobacter sp.]|nr:prepilin peptidase [Dinoroseobacter sp.]
MDVTLTLTQAIWFLIVALPVSVYISWTDMKFMKIPNKAVLVLIAGFAVTGLIALPFDEYLWRYVHLVTVLCIGFVLASAGAMGAGDAKFATAMAPFIAFQDLTLVLTLFAAMLLGAFVAHRLAGRVPAIRSATADWASWGEKRDFPMGLALGGTLVCYLLLPLLK